MSAQSVVNWRTYDDDLTRLRMLLEEAVQAAREAESEDSGSSGRYAANCSLGRYLAAIKKAVS